MAKRKFLKLYNIPTNIYYDGGIKPNFWNSGTMQDIGKGITAFNAGVQMYKGNTPSILSLNQNVHSNNLMGTIGSAVDSTGQILSAIDALTTKERKPLEQTVGLVDSNGVRRFGVGGYMNVGTTALALTGNAIQNAQIADTSNLKNQIQEYSNNANQASSFDDLNTQWANRIDLKHITARDLRNRSLFGDFANSLSSSSQGLSAGSTFGPIGAAVGGIVGGVSSVVGSIFGRNKARKEARKVNSIIDAANARNLASYQNQSSNLGRQQGFNALSNVAAFGGPIGIYGDYGNSAIGYELAKEDLNIKAMNTLSKNKMTALPNSFNTELNTFAEGGGIHIKPSKRGTFTAAAKKHGKGVQEFASQVLANKENYSPAMKKKAQFAKNSASWRHDDGGPLFIESLPEITVTPTNDANFLFSQGIYKVSSRPPLGDKNIRKLVASYLSKYDNENAKEYNKRISRLADAINELGIQFKTNKKDRAYYSPSTGIAYIKTMDDFFGELAHPYQEARGTFKPIHELSEENYDNDKDYRGGTRYAYPDTFEGETHGFFEPALYEWITTGKIGKSSPVINKRQSNEKIVPKDIVEVTDSAASWSKQAAIKRIISKPNQLPFLKRIKYKLIDFPLRDSSRNIIYPKKEQKEHAFGGELTHGGIFNNGINIIGNGGTHESNPHEGVQVGMDAEGIPNLVEEGEVIFNDYVFSNRLNVPNEIKSKYKLSKKKDLTFADAAKQMQKESEERPNDPISKKGLISSMERLQQAQEIVRQQNQVGQEGVQYSHGGRMGTLFDGTGDKPNIMSRAKAKRQGYDVGNSLEDYFKDPVYENENKDTNKGFDLTQLRYAPVIGSAIGLANNLFTKPDYSNADTILSAANKAGNYLPVSYTPIGDYISYTPFDRNYYTNKLNALAGSTTRAIMNSTNPSRYAALLAADYNNQTKLGELERQAEEYNLANRIKTAEFNRGTNQFNSENFLKTAMANQDAAMRANASKLQGIEAAMNMRNMIDTQRSASLSSNLTNLFDSLGSIGKEEFIKDMIKKNPALLYDQMGKYKGKKEKEGGYLTIKKKRN